MSTLKVEPLGSNKERAGFTCGVESLDRYLTNQAGRDGETHGRRRVLSYCVGRSERRSSFLRPLCATSLAPGDVPLAARKHIARGFFRWSPPRC